LRRERARERERESGGTTGGTYCQVGPGGVARVAPLSDSTHKREVGRTLAKGIGGQDQRERQKVREETPAGETLDSII